MGRIRRQGHDCKAMRKRKHKCMRHKRSYSFSQKYSYARHMKVYHGIEVTLDD